MADPNPYDQFVGPPSAPAAAVPAGPNPYDQFVGPPTAPGETKPTLSSVGNQYFYGANSEIASLLGGPVDAMTWLLNKIPGIDIKNAPGGSESLNKGMQALGIHSTDRPAQNAWERGARAAGAGTAAVPLTMMAAAPLADLPVIGPYVAPLSAPPVAGTGLPSAAASAAELGAIGAGGAAGSVAGSVASEYVPDRYKPLVEPLAETAANLLGGSLVAGTAAGTRALFDAAGRLTGRVLAPITNAPVTAGRRILGAATEPQELYGKLDVDNPELVPGSQPTTYQLTGDQGLGNLERAVSARNPSPFLERRAEQNLARVGAISNQAPFEAQPGAVGDYFRRILTGMDAAHEAELTGLRGTAEERLRGIGGGQTPQQAGEAIREGVTQNYAPAFRASDEAIAAQRQGLDEAVGDIGGQRFGSPQEYGQGLRQGLSDLARGEKARVSSLWDIVPNHVQFSTDPIAQGAARIRSQIDPDLARPLAGEEQAIFDAVDRLPETASLAQFQTLRARIGDAVRERIALVRTTEDPIVRRLTQLKGYLDDSLQAGVDAASQHEQRGVAAGVMDPSQTIAARLQGREGALYPEQNVATGSAGLPPGGGNLHGAGARVGAPGQTGVPGAEGAGVGGPGGPAGAPNVAGEAPAGEALDAYEAARLGTRNYKQTYRAGPVGKALEPDARTGGYRMADAAVPARFFNKGTNQSGDVAAFLQAAGSRPQAVDLLQDYAAFDLRRSAMNPDGTINLPKYRRWLDSHQDALSRFPDVQERFSTAARAQEALDNLSSQRAALESAYPLKPGLADADVAAKFWRPGPRGDADVQSLLAATGSNENAVRALQDYAAWNLRQVATRPDGTLDPGRYSAWVRKYDSALSQFPELRAKFADAASAQRAVDDAAANHAVMKQAFEGSAARHFIGTDPDIAVGRAFGTANPEQTFSDLVALTGDSPAASQGLKRAVVDYVLKHFRGNAEAGDTGVNLLKPDAYQTFIAKQAKPLRQLFGDDGFQNLKAVADDLRRANRSIAGTKLPGGSNTAQDTAAMGKLTPSASVLEHIVTEGAAAGAGTVLAGPVGGVTGWLSSKVVGALRAAGIDRVDRLVEEAMLNPALAKTLIAKVPAQPQPYIIDRLARQLQILAASTASQ